MYSSNFYTEKQNNPKSPPFWKVSQTMDIQFLRSSKFLQEQEQINIEGKTQRVNSITKTKFSNYCEAPAMLKEVKKQIKYFIKIIKH